MNKSMKPRPTASAPKELTPEERAANLARFVAQKRESYATSILFGMAQHLTPDSSPETAVSFAVAAADALLDKLFPGLIKPAESKENTQ